MALAVPVNLSSDQDSIWYGLQSSFLYIFCGLYVNRLFCQSIEGALFCEGCGELTQLYRLSRVNAIMNLKQQVTISVIVNLIVSYFLRHHTVDTWECCNKYPVGNISSIQFVSED